MIKIIEQSQELFDTAVSSTVPMHRGGVDKAWIEKRGSANEFGPVFDMLNPKAEHTLIHLIAMGATDRYGINRNGDAFYKNATKLNLHKPDWKTVKTASGKTHYRSPDTFTDQIEQGLLQTYKTFEKNANVYKHHKNKPHMGDKIYGSVKAAAYNDAMDRVELLVEVPNKDWKDELEKLASGDSIPFSMACFPPDALVLTTTGYLPIANITIGDLVMTHTGNWKPVLRVLKREYTGKMYNFQVEGYPYRIEATEEHPFLGVLSAERVKVPNKGDVQLDKPTWKPASVFGRGDTFVHVLPLNWPNLEAIENEHIGAALGTVYGGSDATIVTRSLLLKYLEVGDLYGGLFNSSHSVRLAFLGALFDGVNAKIIKESNSLTWADKNSLMVLLVRDLLLTLGIYCELKPAVLQPSDGPKISGLYIELSASEAVPLRDYSNIVDNLCGMIATPVRTNLDDRFSHYRPVTIYNSYARTVSDVTVFNLEVEEANSYVVGGVVVHNCNVSHDTCSICGHKARNRSEYCEHLTNNLTDMLKTGHVVAMANDNMNFFDISRVNRPADRIAWSLTKSASLGDEEPTPKIEESLPSKYAMTKAAILDKCCKIEKRIQAVGIKAYPVNKINPELLKKLHKESKDTLVDTLSKCSAYLSLEDFVELFATDNPEIKTAAKTAAAYLPELFERIRTSAAPLNPAFDFTGQDISATLQKLSSELVKEVSFSPAPFQKRAAAGSITGKGMGSARTKSASSPSDVENNLLYQYGCYTLGFLESQKRLCPLDFENIQNAVVCSNFVK